MTPIDNMPDTAILRGEAEDVLAFRLHRLRYKVLVVPGLRSSGLLHARVIRYSRRRWNHPAEEPEPGRHGRGGLWANRSFGHARALAKYLKRKHGLRTVIYLCLIDEILYESSYRTKTNRLFLLGRAC